MPSRAFTFERSHCVDAVSSLTDARDGLTLIHILARSSAVVWYEPSSAGVRLCWTHLTGVTPRSSHCGAAQSLCAHNACELALTHLVIHRGKARPGAVVSLTLSPGEAVGTHTSVRSHATPAIETAIFTDRLSTVVSHVAFLTQTVVLCTCSPIHTPNVTVLD